MKYSHHRSHELFANNRVIAEPNYGLHFLEYQWNPPNDSSVLSVMIPSTIMWFK